MSVSTTDTQPSEVPQPVSPEAARVAAAWIASVGADPELLASPPPKPTPAEWRALPVEELRPHLDAMLTSKNPEPGLDACAECGVLDVWMPEVAKMIGFGDGEWRHKDVWKHTKQVVKQSVPRLEVRWGALLHDIGKPRTRKIDAKGRVTFHGHAELGARMYRRKMESRLRFEEQLSERIHFLILHHLRPSQYADDWTDAAVRRFYKQMGDGLKDLLDLSRADITTKRPEKRKRGVHNIHALGQRIAGIRDEDEKPKALPKGLGQHIIKRFDVPPSKRLGNLIKKLQSDVDEGLVEAGLEFEDYLTYLDGNRARFDIDA
ncbi:MAG: HDIG domain-containing metalloprotein [Polyangiales bacterium]